MRPRALRWLGIPAVIAVAALVRAAIPSGSAPPRDPASSASTPVPASAAASASAPTSASAPLSNLDDPRTGEAPPPKNTDTNTDTDASAPPPGSPRVISASPSGVRVALDAKVVVKFDRAPDRQGLSLTFDPPAEGQSSWPDPLTLTFTPVRWADGKPYHARVLASGAALSTFEFRTLFPPPERIEPGHGARVTLTFDDGADRPAQVTALLDLLQKEDIQAIFFPTGRWAERNPRLLERMIADGHRVCNHTYSHQNLRIPQLTDEEIRTEITRGATDGKCRLFRPPLKAFDPRVERIVAELGYTLYLWDVDSRDWEGAPEDDIVNLVLARIHPGAVVLFHMHQQASLDALPRILPRLRKAGYVFRDPPDAGAP